MLTVFTMTSPSATTMPMLLEALVDPVAEEDWRHSTAAKETFETTAPLLTEMPMLLEAVVAPRADEDC